MDAEAYDLSSRFQHLLSGFGDLETRRPCMRRGTPAWTPWTLPVTQSSTRPRTRL